jgi:hypothetical protein
MAIDEAAGIVNLITVLASALVGEWIASDCPVCPITGWGQR